MKSRFPLTSTLTLSLLLFSASTSWAQLGSHPGDWPQWRGPKRDGHSQDKGLLKQWPGKGPRSTWQIDTVGTGYSSLAISGDRIITMGDLHGIEHIIALGKADGRTLWAVRPEPVARKLAEKVAKEFQQMDANQDGQVDEVEALRRLGWNFNKYDRAAREVSPQRRAAVVFGRLDADKDSQLSYTEVGSVFREHFNRIDQADKNADVEETATARATALTNQLDKDGDQALSKAEVRDSILQRAFNRADTRDPSTNKGDEQLTQQEIAKYFASHETAKDGTISPAELAEYYTRNKLAGDGILTVAELEGFYGGYRNGQGDGPRGTPTIEGQRVYAEGANGDVCCLDIGTGKTIWHTNLIDDLGGRRPSWGYSESPLVHGDVVYVTPGGQQGTLVALNKQNGELIWQSEQIKEGAHYSSPIVATIGGIPQIVQFARSNVFGVAIDQGQVLWKYGAANNGTANCCTPIAADDHVFVASGYGTGGGLARIETDNGTQSASEVYFEKKMAIHHGGIVKVGEYMYSNGAGALTCIHFHSGKIAWQARSVGKGSLVCADGMLYLLSERHQMALVEATPDEYRERGRFQIESHGRPSWAHPVVTGGRLYIRDQDSLTAYDVRG